MKDILSSPRFRQVAAITLLSFAVYLNAVPNGPVNDDHYLVLRNPWIRDAGYLPEIFKNNVWTFMEYNSNFYRPMTHVIYMLCYYIFGLRLWGFHLVNVFFHAGVSVLVFLLASALLGNKGPGRHPYLSPPFVAAVLFAVHPIHTEAVAWVAGIQELSFSFFYLLSFYLYIRSRDGAASNKGLYYMSVASFFVSTLCKEPALTLPLILMAHDSASWRKGASFASCVKRYSPFFLVVAVYLAMRYNALGALVPAAKPSVMSHYMYFINTIVLFAHYPLKLLFPMNLSFWHIYRPIESVLVPSGVVSIFAVLALFCFTFVAARKRSAAFVGLLIVMLPLLPALNISSLLQAFKSPFAERYLYLSSFGFVLLLALLIEKVNAGRTRLAAAVSMALALTAVLYTVGTVQRNAFWKDDDTILMDAASKSIDSFESFFVTGNYLFKRGRVDEAVGQLEKALRFDPRNFDAHYNIGVALLSKGQPGKAAEHLRIATEVKPGDAEAHFSLGQAFNAMGLVDKAIEQYKTVTGLDPSSAAAHNNLGLAYETKGWTGKALEEYLTALRLEPASAAVNYNLGMAFLKKGRTAEAVQYLQAALMLDPDDASARAGLAKIEDMNKRAR